MGGTQGRHRLSGERAQIASASQRQFLLFDGETVNVVAVLDGSAVMRWKTAADSSLGVEILARPASRTLCMVSAGVQSLFVDVRR